VNFRIQDADSGLPNPVYEDYYFLHAPFITPDSNFCMPNTSIQSCVVNVRIPTPSKVSSRAIYGTHATTVTPFRDLPFSLEDLLLQAFGLFPPNPLGPKNLEAMRFDGMPTNEMLPARNMFLFLLEGKCAVRAGQQRLSLERGEGLLIKKNFAVLYDAFEFARNRSHDVLIFALSDDLIKEFHFLQNAWPAKTTVHTCLDKIPYHVPLQVFLQSVLLAFDKSASCSPAFLRNKLLELLYHVSDISPDLLSPVDQWYNNQVDELLQLMEANFTQNLTLDEFAQLAGRSLASFKRDFKKVYNTTPHQWILTKRLDYAKQLLEVGLMKVSDICYHAGFESVAHFSKAFKHRYGISPSSVAQIV